AHASSPALGPAGARNDANLHLGLTELRRLGGNDQVAHESQLATAPQCVTADRGYQWLAERAKACPSAEVVVIQHLDRARFRHLADIRARGKGALAAGQDHASDGGLAVEALQSVDDFGDGLMVEGVVDLGPVDGHDADRPISLGPDEFVRHGSLLLSTV